MYFVMPSCGVFLALLRNRDIAGWDGRDHFAKLQLVSPLLTHIAPAGHLTGLAATFLCTVFSSNFASSRSQSFGSPCLLLAMLFSCLLLASCSSALLLSYALRARRRFSSFLPCSTMRAALRAFTVFFNVLVRRLFGLSFSMLLLYLILLFTTCSLTVVPFSDSLTTGSDSVSDPLQRHYVVVYSAPRSSSVTLS